LISFWTDHVHTRFDHVHVRVFKAKQALLNQHTKCTHSLTNAQTDSQAEVMVKEKEGKGEAIDMEKSTISGILMLLLLAWALLTLHSIRD
jgi:hypothetical protein